MYPEPFSCVSRLTCAVHLHCIGQIASNSNWDMPQMGFVILVHPAEFASRHKKPSLSPVWSLCSLFQAELEQRFPQV